MLMWTIYSCLEKWTEASSDVCEPLSISRCIFNVQALNKLHLASVFSVYLDSKAQLQMWHFHHCVSLCVCVLSSYHRQGGSFLSAGWRGGECRAECLVPVCRHGKSFWGWALPAGGETEGLCTLACLCFLCINYLRSQTSS